MRLVGHQYHGDVDPEGERPHLVVDATVPVRRDEDARGDDDRIEPPWQASRPPASGRTLARSVMSQQPDCRTAVADAGAGDADPFAYFATISSRGCADA